MLILGIETSCDETAAAVVETKENSVTVLGNVTATSLALHAKTGGIIPEIAAREQAKMIIPVIKQTLSDAKIDKKAIDAIAVTFGPGLIGSLLVGVETAKTLSLAWNKPLIPINHLLGHMYANFIDQTSLKVNIDFPAIALIVSGGHTDLLLMKQHNDITWLGGTRDDAAGEAYDKIGRELGLPYPAGPAFEKKALLGNPKRFHFPRPLKHDDAFDFSFSGLKTAAMREIQNIKTMTEEDTNDITRCVQDAILDVLIYKTLRAAEKYQASAILLGGGVAANQTLRDLFKQEIARQNLHLSFHAPEKKYCTDNAAMIASAAHFLGNPISWEQVSANPELYFD